MKFEEAEEYLSQALENLIDTNFTIADSECISAATNAIGQGKDVLVHRQKLIKMAGQSESGWRVVDEYQTNQPADDSDDEKKIFKAESRAARKIKAGPDLEAVTEDTAQEGGGFLSTGMSLNPGPRR